MPEFITKTIQKTIEPRLKILTDVAYPDHLFKDGKRTLEGASIFENLVPGIVKKTVDIINKDTFDRIQGTPMMQARMFSDFMKKHYDPVRKIFGEKRFDSLTDFPAKVTLWESKNLPPEEVQERLVRSVASMYWTGARRDPSIFQSEIMGIIRTTLRNLPGIDSRLKEGLLSIIELDVALQVTLKKIDLQRAPTDLKELFHDLFVYTGIFYMIDKINPESLEEGSEERFAKIRVIREEIAQISENFSCHPYFTQIFSENLTKCRIKPKD